MGGWGENGETYYNMRSTFLTETTTFSYFICPLLGSNSKVSRFLTSFWKLRFPLLLMRSGRFLFSKRARTWRLRGRLFATSTVEFQHPITNLFPHSSLHTITPIWSMIFSSVFWTCLAEVEEAFSGKVEIIRPQDRLNRQIVKGELTIIWERTLNLSQWKETKLQSVGSV